MNILKIATVSLCLTLAFGAQARETKPFVCETKLDYTINNKVKTIGLRILGERSKTNTLAGGVFIEIGAKTLILNLPAIELSDDVIAIKGTSTKEQTSVELVYLGNSDGSQNVSNTASVSIRTKNGTLLTASNNDHEITCNIAK